MKQKKIIRTWFDKWEDEDIHNLPISENFKHKSPFGLIEGKNQYINLVLENKDKFLGYRFEIQDEIYINDKACVRYRAIQGDFDLEVSEWYYIKDNLIELIVSYYHIGEIKEDRKLSTKDGHE